MFENAILIWEEIRNLYNEYKFSIGVVEANNKIIQAISVNKTVRLTLSLETATNATVLCTNQLHIQLNVGYLCKVREGIASLSCVLEFLFSRSKGFCD